MNFSATLDSPSSGVNVQSINFLVSRWVQYVEAGETKETGAPLDYRRGETCPAA